jgi:hypothetical protein
MRNPLLLLLLLLTISIVDFFSVSRADWFPQAPSRAPFSLAVPEIDLSETTSLEVRIPTTNIHTLKLRVGQPFADAIDYHKIYTRLNGESANTIQNLTSDLRGKVVTLALDAKQRFHLQPGKNVVEISATDSQGKAYYASFVLIAGATGPAISKGGTAPRVAYRFSGRKFALVVGVSRYKFHEGGLNDLQYADADGRSIVEFLELQQGFQVADVSFMENEQATVEGVRAALKLFLPQAGDNDLVFLFIASHGAPDPFDPKNLYLLLHDTKVADMPHTALNMSELRELFAQHVVAKRVVMFIDACHSAGVAGTKLVTGRQLERLENNVFNLYASTLYREAGRAVLTSSDVNEISEEGAKWGGGHGVFTWALLEGLRGGADQNRDRVITAGELFDYVSDRVRVETNSRQNPRALPGTRRDFSLALTTK